MTEQKPCEHEMEYVGKSSDVTFYGRDGSDYYLDIFLYECKKCGDLKVDID